MDAIEAIKGEVESATKKFPLWPRDPIHAASVLSEESGELVRAANNFVYHAGDRLEMLREAIQVGAMAVRFIEHMAEYHDIKSEPYGGTP